MKLSGMEGAMKPLLGTPKHWPLLVVLQVSLVLLERFMPNTVNKDLATPKLEGNAAIPPMKDKAISERLATLSRCPQCIAHLLAKRSESKARMMAWADALTDATRVWIFSRLFTSDTVVV
jgi:hypothetical protein